MPEPLTPPPLRDGLALGIRAVACNGWRWLPGCQRISGSLRRLPDFAEPASLGCLLALVRETWNEPELHLVPRVIDDEIVWCVEEFTLPCVGVDGQPIRADSEAAALVAALEESGARTDGAGEVRRAD